jgi:basic membrane protein A
MQSSISRRTCLTALAGAPVVRAANSYSDRLIFGFIYNGPKNDLGYNQAHAEGKAALASIPWVRAFEESNVPETVAVEESMRDMIHQDGACAIFATSYGFLDPFVFRVAR